MKRHTSYEWDDAKRLINAEAHGVDFAEIEAFDWSTAIIGDDTRNDYRERRQIAVGLITNRVHVCVFTDRGTTRRIISLRKANRRETLKYIGA